MKDPRTKVKQLYQDNNYVMDGTEDDFLIYIHKNHSFSYDWALKYEGFNIRIKYDLPEMSYETHEVISIFENFEESYLDIQEKLKRYKERGWFDSFYVFIKRIVYDNKSWFKNLNEELDLRRISPKHIAWFYWSE